MWKSYIWYSLLPVLFSVVCTWTYSQSVELLSSEGPRRLLRILMPFLHWFICAFSSVILSNFRPSPQGSELHFWPNSQKTACPSALTLHQKLSSQKSPNPCHWPLHPALPTTFPLTTQRNCFPPLPERHLFQEAWIPCFLPSSQAKFTRMVYNSIIVG